MEILLENKNNRIQVSIKDEGIGIPKQDIAQLFQNSNESIIVLDVK